MFLPTDNSAILTFVSFLLRHIATIDRSAIFLAYDNSKTVQADAIAKALHSQSIPITCFRITDPGQQSVANVIKQSLTISLVDEPKLLQNIVGDNLTPIVRFAINHNPFIFVISDTDVDRTPPMRYQLQNLIHVVLRSDGNGLHFVVFPIDKMAAPMRITNEAAFIASSFWLAFCNRVNRKQMAAAITVQSQHNTELEMDVVRSAGQPLLVTGIFVGLLRILAERLASDDIYMAFRLTKERKTKQIFGSKFSYRIVNNVDWRQTLAYQEMRPVTGHYLEFGSTNTIDDWLPGLTNRYLVLAPFVIEPSVASWSVLKQRALLLAMIYLTTLTFLGIRLISRRLHSCRPVDRTELLLDTFARTLGTSSGSRTTLYSDSESQLLVVVSVFCVLMGSIFSGILYERSFVRPEKQRFQSLRTVCNGQVRIQMDSSFFDSGKGQE